MNKKGFTLIEVIVSIAILSIVLGVLSTSISMIYRHYNASNMYKEDSDLALYNVQGGYDQNVQMKSADYKLEINGTNMHDEIQLNAFTSASYHQKTINIDSSAKEKKEAVYLTRFEAQAKDIDTKFFIVDASTGKVSKMPGLENLGVGSYDDLPNASWEALKNMNKEWGKWSFAGWSLSPATYDTNGNVTSVKENMYDSWDKNRKKPYWVSVPTNGANNTNNRYYYTGCTYELTYDNGEWKGLITEDNFADFKEKVANGVIDMKHYALVPTYYFSKDIYNSDLDTILLNDADNTLREARDTKNIQLLAQAAARWIKKNSLQKLEQEVSYSNRQNGLYGKGLEIIHFREAGWGVLGEKDYSRFGNRNKGKPSSYESSATYKDLPHLNDGTWNQDNGFIKAMFESIGFDITKINDENDWLGIRYSYNRLLFANKMADSEDSHPYSLFIKVNQNKQEVTVFVGKSTSSGSWWNTKWSDPREGMVINPNYVATASYA